MKLRETNAVLAASHLGITFAVLLAGSFYLGWKVDERLGTTPVFVLLGCALGFGGGVYFLYREVYGRRPEGEESEGRGPRGPGAGGGR